MVRAVHKLFKLSYNKSINSLPKPYIDYLEKSRLEGGRYHEFVPETKFLDYNQDHESGYVYRVPDQPIPVTKPPNSYNALWGGLGMVEGFHKPKKLKPRITRIWFPLIEKHTFYSEILDTRINIEVTKNTLKLIDQNQGFDFYILNTSVQDLGSDFGRILKHKILLALAKENNRDYITKKYKDYIKPIDEIIWYGLKEHEALSKFKQLRIEEGIEPPLKQTYGRQLLDRLKKEKTINEI